MSVKIHIINMDKDRDRWNRCTQLLQRRGFEYERFPGIDISKIDIRPYRTKGFNRSEILCALEK